MRIKPVFIGKDIYIFLSNFAKGDNIAIHVLCFMQIKIIAAMSNTEILGRV